jgi:hypothetical protein
VIPDGARQRDLIGYGRDPSSFSWPDGALAGEVLKHPMQTFRALADVVERR